MSSTTPHLDAASIIQKISAGEVSRDFIESVSKGYLPLPQDELVAVLSFLVTNPDGSISSQARQSLKELPGSVLLHLARNISASPEHLTLLAYANEDPTILESLLRNRSTPDDVIRTLAATVGPALQEVIVINQERILRAPEILEALLGNLDISPDVRRRALETREEFFDKRARLEIQRLQDEAEEALIQDLSPIADLLEAAEKAPADDLLSDQPPVDLSPDQESVFIKLLKMGVKDRVQRAFKGSRTERTILIRDRNKLVCTAVIRSPRMTDSEVESYAGMRNLDDEVLRVISLNRGWMSKTPIMQALVRNPKTPIGVVLPLINRLTLKDLKSLGTDKNVSEVVRTSAKKLYALRNRKNA